jgi:hypothetical protein
MSRRETSLPRSAADLFAGSGRSREALRSIDWAATPLGDVATWPLDLCAAARIVVAAPAPMLLWWGSNFHQLHNDALIDAVGDDDPAVGRAAKECWPERWDVLGPSARLVLAENEPIHLADVALPSRGDSSGHWTVSLGPLADDDGRVTGVLATAIDLSRHVSAREDERLNNEVTVANLQLALASNRRIGTAIGILMAHGRITDDAAFDLLRMASQGTHRKLRDIADEVVHTGALPLLP